MDHAQGGFVSLVGAGPGDPGLITVKAIERLQQADVVIHDRLINHSLLGYASRAQFIDVGKQPDRHPVKQSQINQLLVEHALTGKRVVRLKGGDPFVFGRGGEEALTLFEAGIPFEIIPGISSAIAAPAYAGIPITQRSVACSAAIITGHRADCTADPDSDWVRAARGADTLVFLMGVQNLPRIVEQVLSAGRSAETPVALIEQATCRAQKTVTGTLADIVSKAEQVCPPAVIVIGDVVSLRESLRWYDLPGVLPLAGLRVVNTRPHRQKPGCTSAPVSQPLFGCQDPLSQLLANQGAWLIEIPTTISLPYPDLSRLTAAVDRLVRGDSRPTAPGWMIFTAESEVRVVFDYLYSQALDSRHMAGLHVAALSEPASAALRSYGILPDFQASSPDNLAAYLSSRGAGEALLPHYGEFPQQLITCLENHGIQVEAVQASILEPVQADPAAARVFQEGDVDVVIFFTPTAVNGLANILDGRPLEDILASCKVVCVGEPAAEAAMRYGLQVERAAEGTTDEAIVEMMEK